MRGRKKKEKGMLQRLKSRKRKKFGTVFLQRWLIVMLVVALLYAEGLAIFTTYQKNMYAQNLQYAHSELSEECAFLPVDDTEQEMLNYLSYKMASRTIRYNTFSYVCDARSFEILAGCEEKLFLVKKRQKGDRLSFLTCETDKITGWDAYRQQIAEDYKPFRSIFELLHCNYIDSNGKEFIPRSLEVRQYIQEMPGADLESAEDVITFKPNTEGSITEGYEYEYIGAYWMGSIIVAGYSPDSPSALYNKSHDDGYALLNRIYEKVQYEPQTYWAEQSFWGIKMGYIVPAALPNGREVLLIMATSLNVWKNFGSILILVGLITVTLGTILAFLLAKVSYTRLKAAYALEDYRKNLTNTMAHDLKSPLMSISGYAENLQANLNTQKQTYYSEAILNSVQYMNGIIESVLYLSKMEEGKQILRKEALQVREVFDKLVAERKESFEERGLRIETAGDTVLEADATLLEQLLCNLLDNAAKYASKDTTICVMMKDKQISIQNVCEEDLSAVVGTLCDPFVVSDDSRSNRKGSGLGLAIAKNICELHGFGFELICKEKSFEAKIKG